MLDRSVAQMRLPSEPIHRIIAGLALQDEMLNAAKVGVLGAWALAAVIGMSMLNYILPKR